MFSKETREIYRFNEGTKMRGADPLAIQKRLGLALKNCKHDIALLQLKNEESIGAFDRLVKGAREAFQIEEFHEDEDGVQSGLMDQEVIDLLADFFKWLGDVKKKAEKLQSKPKLGDLE